MEKRLFFLINKARHKIFSYGERLYEKELGVPLTQVIALFVLEKNNGCLAKDLCEPLMIKKSAISGLTDRMEKNGLITRQQDDYDKRAIRLFITKAGQECIKNAKPLLQKQNEKISASFNEDELAIVQRFLNHVIEQTDTDTL